MNICTQYTGWYEHFTQHMGWHEQFTQHTGQHEHFTLHTGQHKHLCLTQGPAWKNSPKIQSYSNKICIWGNSFTPNLPGQITTSDL